MTKNLKHQQKAFKLKKKLEFFCITREIGYTQKRELHQCGVEDQKKNEEK